MKIVLVRHGRSAHVVKGVLDHAGFLRWREEYEAAGIDPADAPPPELVAAARDAGVLVSSDIRRAIESVRALAEGRDVIVTPLLRELTLDPPNVRWLRFPFLGWALLIAGRWLVRQALRRPNVTPEEARRVRDAASWLIELASTRGEVLVLTHGSFRTVLASELEKRAWTFVPPQRRSSHWSAWSFAPMTAPSTTATRAAR